jgi:MoaA/NifB/PqqE/SkfB family radical SAM enzyme
MYLIVNMSPTSQNEANMSIIEGWDAPQADFLSAHSEQRLHKLVTHFWNACNLACPGCFVHKSTDPESTFSLKHKSRYPDEMSLETQKALFDEAKELGAKVVDIVGAGEPTLDPHFDELVEYAHQQGLYTVIFTHGATRMFQDKQRLARYKDKPISFFVKLWSQKPELQNHYVQGSVGNYTQLRDTALQHLEELGFMDGDIVEIDQIPRRKTRVGADILVMKSNYDEVPDLFRYCRQHNIMPEIKTYIPEGPTRFDHERGFFKDLPQVAQQELKDDEVSPEEFATLRKELQRIDQEEFGNPALPYFYPQAVFCTQSMASAYVTIRSELLSCVGTNLIYGKYTPGKKMLSEMLHNRKETVSLGCMPRIREAENRGNFIPEGELKILSLAKPGKTRVLLSSTFPAS